MKKNNNDRIKVIMGLMILFLVAVAVLALFKPIPDKQNEVAANDSEQTTNETATAETDVDIDVDTASEPEAATALQAVTTEYIPVAHEIAELPTTTATTDRPEVTTSPPQTTVSEKSKKETAVTTTKIVEVTLAPVEIPDDEVMSVLEEYDITIPETPTTTAQTTPPPTSGMPEGAQGTDEYGNIYKKEDGQKYVWDPVLGWGEDNGDGYTIVMDVKSDGYTS